MIDTVKDQLGSADWSHLPPQLEGMLWFLGFLMAGMLLFAVIKMVFAAARWDSSRGKELAAKDRLANIETTLADCVLRLKSIEERVDKLQKADEKLWGKR